MPTILKVDDDHRVVIGVALVTNEPDSQGDVISLQ